MIKSIKSLGTIGGKHRLLPKLVPIVNYTLRKYDLDGFLDLFGGGNKLIPQLGRHMLSTVIYNEIDQGIVNLFTCLADRDEANGLIELTYQLSKSINSQEDFDNINNRRRSKDTPRLESAALTILTSEYSRASDRIHYMRKDAEKGVSRTSLNRFHELVPSMRNTEITCKSYQYYLFKWSHRSDLLAFLDPPYVDSDIYPDSFTRTDHKEMIDLIVDTKMRVILCGTDNDIYDAVLTSANGWTKYCLGYIKKNSAATKNSIQLEYIWTNFELDLNMVEGVRDVSSSILVTGVLGSKD